MSILYTARLILFLAQLLVNGHPAGSLEPIDKSMVSVLSKVVCNVNKSVSFGNKKNKKKTPFLSSSFIHTLIIVTHRFQIYLTFSQRRPWGATPDH